MNADLRGYALAVALLVTAGMSQARPIDDCRNANQASLSAIQVQRNTAARAFEVTQADLAKYDAMREPLLPKPGSSGTLKDCQEKTANIARLKETLTAMIAASDKQLAACRRTNRDQMNRVETAIAVAAGTAGKGGITKEHDDAAGRLRNTIHDEEKKAIERGYTMADCRANATRVQGFQAYIEKICIDRDTRRFSEKMECIKV